MPRTKPQAVRQRRRHQVQRLSNRARLRELRGQAAATTQPSQPPAHESSTQA